jgi:hypothetical protein
MTYDQACEDIPKATSMIGIHECRTALSHDLYNAPNPPKLIAAAVPQNFATMELFQSRVCTPLGKQLQTYPSYRSSHDDSLTP